MIVSIVVKLRDGRELEINTEGLIVSRDVRVIGLDDEASKRVRDFGGDGPLLAP